MRENTKFLVGHYPSMIFITMNDRLYNGIRDCENPDNFLNYAARNLGGRYHMLLKEFDE